MVLWLCDFTEKKSHEQSHKKKAWFINVSRLFFLFCDSVTLFFKELHKNYMIYIGSFCKKQSHKVTMPFLHVKSLDLSAFPCLWLCDFVTLSKVTNWFRHSLRVKRQQGQFCYFVTLQKSKVTSKVTEKKPDKSMLFDLFFYFVTLLLYF